MYKNDLQKLIDASWNSFEDKLYYYKFGFQDPPFSASIDISYNENTKMWVIDFMGTIAHLREIFDKMSLNDAIDIYTAMQRVHYFLIKMNDLKVFL